MVGFIVYAQQPANYGDDADAERECAETPSSAASIEQDGNEPQNNGCDEKNQE